MKKVLVSILGAAALTGCAYDYYNGGVKYTQDGPDCIYQTVEKGSRFSNDVDSMNKGKKVVYRNTICANLYEKDTADQPAIQERKVLTTAATAVPCTACSYKADFAPCAKSEPVMKRRYVIVSGM